MHTNWGEWYHSILVLHSQTITQREESGQLTIYNLVWHPPWLGWAVTSFSGLPYIISFVCHDNNTWKRKSSEKWGRPAWRVHCMNVITWTQGGRRVAGPIVNFAYLHLSISQLGRFEGFTARQDSRLCKQFRLTVFKLTHDGPCHSHIHVAHVMNSPRPSLFFATLPLPCIIDNANENRGRPGNEARCSKYVWTTVFPYMAHLFLGIKYTVGTVGAVVQTYFIAYPRRGGWPEQVCLSAATILRGWDNWSICLQ